MSSGFDEIQWSGELLPRHELASDGSIPMEKPGEQMSDWKANETPRLAALKREIAAMKERAEKAEAERDAIEAATIERCAHCCALYEHPGLSGATEDWRDGHNAACLGLERVIRAFARLAQLSHPKA
jgi:hypothetical protein